MDIPSLFPAGARPGRVNLAKRAINLLLGTAIDAEDPVQVPFAPPAEPMRPMVPRLEESAAVAAPTAPIFDDDLLSSAASREEESPPAITGGGMVPGAGNEVLRRYLYSTMPQPPAVPAAPERDLRGEAKRTGIGALVSALVLGATGNRDAISPSIAAYLAGSKHGNDDVADNENQNYQNDVRSRLQQFQLRRQAAADANDATQFQMGIDDKQQQQQFRQEQLTEQTRRANVDDARLEGQNRQREQQQALTWLSGLTPEGRQSAIDSGFLRKSFPTLDDEDIARFKDFKKFYPNEKNPAQEKEQQRRKMLQQEVDDTLKIIMNPLTPDDVKQKSSRRLGEIKGITNIGPGDVLSGGAKMLPMTPAQAAVATDRDRSGDQRDRALNQRDTQINVSQEGLKLRQIAFEAKQATGGGSGGKAKNPDVIWSKINTVTSAENTYRAAIERMRPKPRLVKGVYTLPDGAMQEFQAKAAPINALIRDARATRAKLMESVGMKASPDGKGGYVPMSGKSDTTKTNAPGTYGSRGVRSPALDRYIQSGGVQPGASLSSATPITSSLSGNGGASLLPAQVVLNPPAQQPVTHHSQQQPRKPTGQFKPMSKKQRVEKTKAAF